MKAKVISCFMTLTIHFLTIVALGILDSYQLIINIFSGSALLGLVVKYLLKPKNNLIKNFGWGILFGSAFSLILTVGFVKWMEYTFPQ